MAKRFAKTDKTGRTQSGDKFAKVFLVTMQSPAWRALTPYAQRLHPWLLLEWGGPNANNNGRIAYTVKQAAEALGCNTETARKAFLDLQAKGFLVVTRCAALGTVGTARAHEYELTELGMPKNPVPRKLYRDWKPDCDFPVVTANVNNPRGVGGAQNLKPQLTERVETGRPQLTGQGTPNLPCKSKSVKNGQTPTYGVSHPYLPGGLGERRVSQPVKGRFIGEPRRFAILRSGIPIRVGVRTTMRRNAEACS